MLVFAACLIFAAAAALLIYCGPPRFRAGAPATTFSLAVLLFYFGKYAYGIDLGLNLIDRRAGAEALLYVATTSLVAAITLGALQRVRWPVWGLAVSWRTTEVVVVAAFALFFSMVIAYIVHLKASASDPLAIRLAMQSGGNYVFFQVVVLCVSYLLLRMKQTRLALWGAGTAIVLAAFFSGVRGLVVVFAIYVCIYRPMLRGRSINVPAVATFGLLIIPFVTITGLARDYLRAEMPLSEAFQEALKIENVELMFHLFFSRFDSFENFVALMDNIHGLSGVSVAYLALVAFVPRELMPEKPYKLSAELTRQLNPEVFEANVALTYSVFSEAYVAFEMWGILVYGLCLGVVLAILNQVYKEGLKDVRFAFASFCLFLLPFEILSAGLFADIALMNVVILVIFLSAMKTLAGFFGNSRSGPAPSR